MKPVDEMPISEAVKEARKRLAAALPEDEPDFTPEWVVELLIQLGKETVQGHYEQRIQWLKEQRDYWHTLMVSRTGHLQAKIDELMLEYCPLEMSYEQKKEWERHQRVSDFQPPRQFDEDIAMAETDYEAIEREFMGDPELKTGIYHPDVIVEVDKNKKRSTQDWNPLDEIGSYNNTNHSTSAYDSPAPFYARIGRSSPP